ncbi:AI-2E family transporter [Aerolutibacter ruishenii]|uniref:Putative PurR-regulated permease PerM n=1 Tax=Aerolutibacter ruishenii TaxID=686800 RepID=A0A562M348_9GAMM|nr:putative PurR-regulated permease PerM [Lysobacter ruishenii]
MPNPPSSGTNPDALPTSGQDDQRPAPPTAAQAELPARPRSSMAAMVLATLAIGFTLWATQGLVLPILLAMFFALVGNPIIRGLQRLYFPRFLAALVVLIGGIAITVLLGSQLVEPVGDWMREVPREMRSVAPKLQRMVKPVQEANKAAENIARAAGGESTSKPVQVVKTEANDPYKALTTTPRMAASVLAVVLLTFFFMVYGENLQKKALALLPGRQQQRLTVEILQSIEREMSRYVLTISVINGVVGLVFAGALMLLGVPMPEALMWGTMAALLNFAPYVGPLIGIIVMLLMGFVTFDDIWQSLLPAGIYLLLHTLEGQIITPIVLGRRMAISPLMLILALMVFGWLWGFIGLLLAVPLLVCVKLVLERVEGLEGWARLLE